MTRGGLRIALIVLVVAAAGCGNGSSHSRPAATATVTATATASPTATPTRLPIRSGTPVVNCGSLSQIALPLTMISSAAIDPGTASTASPVCVVRGDIGRRTGVTNPDNGSDSYGTRFELRLPTAWNGRFFYQGGAGLNGVVGAATGFVIGSTGPPALTQGFAVVSSDGGHRSPIMQAGFGVDPDARVDYGYRSIEQVTPVAKALIETYYGTLPHHSYFLGCSKGGQEGMQASQRYGDQFDGVVAGDPAFNLSRVAIGQVWDTQAFAAAARALSPEAVDAAGHPLLYTAISPASLQLITQRVLEACDDLDGLEDGVIFNQSACARVFDPATLQCAGEPDGSCLLPEQLNALERVFEGARDSQGRPLYADWPYDSGIGSFGWALWKIGAETDQPVNSGISPSLASNAMRYLFATPPDPTIDVFTLDIDVLARSIVATGVDPVSHVEYPVSAEEYMSADSTQLDGFKAKGGKLIFYHGASDPVFSLNDITRYYDDLTVAYGDETASFARLFVVPGMNHCYGGDYALDRFDMLPAIVDWVEQGRAPGTLVATVDAQASALPAGTTRPLCPYPSYTEYLGSGEVNSAASYRCVRPVSE